MPNTALNRTTQTLMTNKSGGSVAYGGVVIVDTTTDSSFTTTTTGGLSTAQVGVVLEPNGIANNALGMVAVGGWCPRITLNTASTRGQFIKTHTVAGQGTPHSSPQVEGDFAVALEASTTPACNLFGSPNGPLAGGAGTVTHTAGALTANAVVVGNASADITVLASLGTSGQVLTSNGAGTPPSFQSASSAFVLLEQHTASSSASLDFTTWYSSTYDDYQIEFVNVLPATNNVELGLRCSTNGGSSYDSTSVYANDNARLGGGGFAYNETTTTKGQLGSNAAMSNSATFGGECGFLKLYGPGSATGQKRFIGTLYYTFQSGSPELTAYTNITYQSTTAVNAFQFFFSSGNIASGTIRVYGLTK